MANSFIRFCTLVYEGKHPPYCAIDVTSGSYFGVVFRTFEFRLNAIHL